MFLERWDSCPFAREAVRRDSDMYAPKDKTHVNKLNELFLARLRPIAPKRGIASPLVAMNSVFG